MGGRPQGHHIAGRFFLEVVQASSGSFSQVAKDPFSPESIEHWADADDGSWSKAILRRRDLSTLGSRNLRPWQVLARYLELAEVYSRPGLEEASEALCCRSKHS